MIEHERLTEIEAERQQIDAREAVLKAEAAAINEQRDQRMADWEEACALAVELGAGRPPRPDPPETSEMDEERMHLRYRREALKGKERKSHAAIRDEQEAASAAVVAEAIEDARPAVAILEAALAKIVPEWRDVLKVRLAVDLADPNATQKATGLNARSLQQQPTMHDLLDLLQHGGNPLAIRQPPAISDTQPHVDRGAQEQPSTLGLQRGSSDFGTPTKTQAPRRRTGRDWT